MKLEVSPVTVLIVLGIILCIADAVRYTPGFTAGYGLTSIGLALFMAAYALDRRQAKG